MITKTVTEYVNYINHHDMNDYALTGQFVHHYLVLDIDGYAITTHCHITGGSQLVTFDTHSDVVAYLRGFEAI